MIGSHQKWKTIFQAVFPCWLVPVLKEIFVTAFTRDSLSQTNLMAVIFFAVYGQLPVEALNLPFSVTRTCLAKSSSSIRYLMSLSCSFGISFNFSQQTIPCCAITTQQGIINFVDPLMVLLETASVS